LYVPVAEMKSLKRRQRNASYEASKYRHTHTHTHMTSVLNIDDNQTSVLLLLIPMAVKLVIRSL